MTISPELQKIYTQNPSGAYYMEAVTLRHPGILDDIHITNASVNFNGIANGKSEKFISLPFVTGLPDKDTTGTQSMRLVFTNVTQALVDDVERMSQQAYEPCSCWYRVYIYGNKDASGVHVQHLRPAWLYEINDFIITSEAITAVASRVNMHNRPFPRRRFTATEFPGLDR